MEVLSVEPNVLNVSVPINICGDIHGQFDDLLQLFVTALNLPNTPRQEYSLILQSDQRFLFMGDYVDRGYHSLNTFLYLACLKLKKRDSFFLLRGNHESRLVSRTYGLFQECVSIYGHSQIWSACNEAFDLLPVAAIVSGRLFAVHGGLSRDLPYVYLISELERRTEIPSDGPLADLCWSDPENVTVWRRGERGTGWLFGAPHVHEFLHLNRLDNIARSHQLAVHGYEIKFPKPNCGKFRYQLFTVWSAPNYGYTAGNKASVLKLGFSEKDWIQFVQFGARPIRIEPASRALVRSYFV
jgi:diadenosine tetraphosphatase ApaH/serine/threonine PP2A family protein phosphatase